MSVGLERIESDVRPWGLALAPAACEVTGRTWLVPEDALGGPTPDGRGRLEASAAQLPVAAPEQLVRPTVDRGRLQEILGKHVGGLWFPDPRLRAPDLASRATLIWWPRWLVDASVGGSWSAEVGFDYDAHSTVEELRDGSWRTRETVETRVRWEPRAGTLDRRYDNVVVHALANEGPAGRLAGEADVSPFDGAALDGGAIWLPDRSPSEVWAAAEPAFRERAAEDVRAAAGGQHVRDVHLAPEYADDRWTVRLHPAWMTWYTDDDGVVYTLVVDAVGGRAWGPVLASTRRAWLWTGGLAAAGALVLLLTLLVTVLALLFPPILVVSTVLGLVGLGLLVGAAFPVVSVWAWNARQRKLVA